MKPKVLIDLSLSLMSNSGIPLDTKWLYKQLASSKDVEAYGLIYPSDDRTEGFNIKKGFEKYKNLRYSQYLALLSEEKTAGNSIMDRNRYLKRIKRISSIYKTYFKSKFEIKEIENKDFNEVIFRLFFESGLSPKDREFIQNSTFYMTDLFRALVFARTMSPIPTSPILLNTKGFDFIINQDSVPLKVSKGTQQIIRYHDPIPVKDPDYFSNSSVNATYHYLGIKKCVENGAIYVCNSEPVEQELLKLFPELEGRTLTIPYTISEVYKPSHDFDALFDILESKFSSRFSKYAQNWRKEIAQAKSSPESFKYIAEVCTIEPRKNYLKLFKAFTYAKSKLNKEGVKLKLIIAGSLGWKYDQILKELEPLIEKGDVALMENLHPNELKYLFSHAQAFVFPSVKEGFGLPPVEAMLCGTPVITSDINEHRWVQGDSSFYVDPYNFESLGEKIFYVVKNRESVDTKKRIEMGIKKAKAYNANENEKKWNRFFSDFKEGKYRIKD